MTKIYLSTVYSVTIYVLLIQINTKSFKLLLRLFYEVEKGRNGTFCGRACRERELLDQRVSECKSVVLHFLLITKVVFHLRWKVGNKHEHTHVMQSKKI